MVFMMENTPSGAGMGTSGLVGLFGAYEAMGSTGILLVLKILLVNVVLPGVLVLIIYLIFRKLNLIKVGDLKINTGEKR
ncbi:MAG: PTS sugar transporter subunit IIC, partial [Bacilli bacterium]|nr:PTS sugar transporter subunit IIC [Bacilli bacterium]